MIADNISWPQTIIASYMGDYIPEEETGAEGAEEAPAEEAEETAEEPAEEAEPEEETAP